MKADAEILIKLLRLGLGESGFKEVVKKDKTEPDGLRTDWNALLDLACAQGIAGIAVDGLQVLSDSHIEISLDSDENEDIRYDWYGQQLIIESESQKYVSALSSLIKRLSYHESGRIMILKGYGLALDYPEPMHRSFGDMDIFSLDGKSCDVDDILSSFPGFQRVRDIHSRHSHASYKDFPVENHFHFTNSGSGSKDGIEQFLLEEARSSSTAVNISGAIAYLPSATFNAIFLIWHMAAHFKLENINLRQLCDLLVFYRKNGDGIDWPAVNDVLTRCGKKRIADIINGSLIDYFGLEASLVPEFEHNPEEERRFLDFVLYAPKLKTRGLEAVLKYWRRRWNFRLAGDESWAAALLGSIRRHLIDIK